MATLDINGTKVTVDDAFLSMSPEQQNATVEEIAGQLKLGAKQQPSAAAPSSPLQQGRGQRVSGSIEDRTQPSIGDKLATATAATANGLVNGIPVIGPLAQNVTDAIGGGISQLTGGNYNDYVRRQQDLRARTAQAAPAASIAGNIGGGLASMGALGAVPAAAEAMGFTAARTGLPGLAQRTVNSGLSTMGLGAADNMARGDKPTDAVANATGPAAISALFPVGGAALRAAGRGAYEGIVRPIATAANRENEAVRRVGRAITQDRNSGQTLGAAEAAAATRAGAPIYNADRFGSAIRGLARTSLNVSPEAENALRGAVQDRFYTQGPRAAGFVRQLMNGATDDLALQDQLRETARRSNSAAYARAYGSPQAAGIWDNNLQNLMQSPEFSSAVRTAERAAQTDAALSGTRAVRSPFVFDQNGGWQLRRNADGSTAIPNLQFWDIVQRELRKAQEALGPRELSQARTLGQLRTQLLGNLDARVPDFRAARQGAAGFFGAEDAVDAGRRAVTSTRDTPEIARAVQRMTPAEREAFSVGFTSEIIDGINATGDRVNVINKMFGSTQARQRIEIALGPQRARQLEAYTRVEQIMDELRTAVSGNSTTAKQLIAAGILGGGAGLWASGGNPQTAFTWATLAALGRRGAQMMGKKVDDQVMRRVSEMLVSRNPADVERAIQNAALSEQHLEALRAIMQGLQIMGRGAVMGVAAN